MRLRGRPRQVAGHLARVLRPAAQEREHRHGRVAVLGCHDAEVHGACVDPGWRAGLEPPHLEGQFPQARREPDGSRVARPATGMAGQSDMDATGEEGADRQDHRARLEAQPRLCDHAGDAAVLDDQVVHALLEELQVRLPVEQGTNGVAVERAVRLAAGARTAGPAA